MAITNKDVEKLKEVFATKEDLQRLKEETEKTASERHGEIMKNLDKLMKEKETAREDRTLAIGKDRERDRRLDDHDARIKKLEVGV